MNIPIYRAKKIDSDEYVKGSLDFSKAHDYFHIIDDERTNHTIDKSTLAIHFPDMLDNEEVKIFASLSDSGKGGDLTETKDGRGIYKRVHIMRADGLLCSRDLEKIKSITKFNGVVDLKAIGIQP